VADIYRLVQKDKLPQTVLEVNAAVQDQAHFHDRVPEEDVGASSSVFALPPQALGCLLYRWQPFPFPVDKNNVLSRIQTMS
jgi:hypothetical protein